MSKTVIDVCLGHLITIQLILMRKDVNDRIGMTSDVYIYLELSFIIKISLLIQPLRKRDKIRHALDCQFMLFLKLLLDICIYILLYIYIYIYYGDVIHQRHRQMYIYAYAPARRLVYIIYTSGPLYSPGERFISTNNGSISSNCYRVTKFLAKMTFILFASVNLSICTPANTSSSVEKQTFRSIQSLLHVFRCEG